MQFAKIDRSSVTEQIIEYFKDQIFKQKLKPGQQLPSEENLGAQMGVGRGTVREALRVLVYLGLIERRNKSTYVTSVVMNDTLVSGFTDRIRKHRDVMQMIEVRKIVEPEAAALAAENANDENIQALLACLNDMEQYKDDLKKFIVCDKDFHLALFSACGNHILLELMKGIQEYMHQNQVLVLQQRPGILPRSLDFHHKIFDAVKAGKTDAARKIMKAHILDIEEEMCQIIKSGAAKNGE